MASLGLSLAAVALLVVLIFVPLVQTFSSSDLSLSYPSTWTSLDTSKVSTCQNSGCLIVLDYNDSQTQIFLADLKINNSSSIESLDQQLWNGMLQQGAGVELIATSYMQVDGHPASRRTFSLTTNGETVYAVMGLIQAKSTLYQYMGVSQNAASHQAHLAEVDQIIQSIRFTP